MSAADRAVALAAYRWLACHQNVAGAASGHELAVRLMELDQALHDLYLAAGLSAPGCHCDGCEFLRSLELERLAAAEGQQ